GKQRTQRSVDEACRQDFLLGGTPLALEEPSRDTAGSVGFLGVIDRQGEEVLTGLGVLGAYHGCEHTSVVHCYEYGTRRLASNLTGFQRHSVLTVLKRFAHFVEHCFSLQNKKPRATRFTSQSPRLSLGELSPGYHLRRPSFSIRLR